MGRCGRLGCVLQWAGATGSLVRLSCAGWVGGDWVVGWLD